MLDMSARQLGCTDLSISSFHLCNRNMTFFLKLALCYAELMCNFKAQYNLHVLRTHLKHTLLKNVLTFSQNFSFCAENVEIEGKIVPLKAISSRPSRKHKSEV